ncbi:low density lipoprotein receptor adapter protein 1-like [Daktulosphaira vitifoliae]|uniref:low density lipoprotein receptor adapter protein 1-like n=1 Tax=Daktulosphaira vitifoliae TaxID=58002 RepID=UPI0021A9D338|nr:low density lipoprotein receptor adapter protein 1-like [Daktulosphaira vitifoliae]
MPLSLKSIWKGNSKHKKLSEDKTLGIGQNVDDVTAITAAAAADEDLTTFDVKYLGITPVASVADAVAEAVKTILVLGKASKRKPQNVTVSLNPQGIKVTDTSDEKNTVLDTPIERISHYFTDQNQNNVIAFVVTANGQTMSECHAFLCAKRKMAQSMFLSVSQIISSIPEVWKEYANKSQKLEAIQAKIPEAPIEHCVQEKSTMSAPQKNKEVSLIDLSGEPLPRQQYDTSRWVCFDDDKPSMDLEILHQRPETFANFSHHFNQDRQMCY